MTHLSDVEIRALIGRYESELRKLAYQAGKVKETIAELKQFVHDTNGSSGIDFSSIADIPSPPPRASVRELLGSNPEVDLPETGSGYRLSNWDIFVLESLKEANMTLVNADFFKLAAQKIKREGLELSKQQLHGKINRSIHKLTHKRGILRKVQFAGKGYAYALNKWFDDEDNLMFRYKRKSL